MNPYTTSLIPRPAPSPRKGHWNFLARHPPLPLPSRPLWTVPIFISDGSDLPPDPHGSTFRAALETQRCCYGPCSLFTPSERRAWTSLWTSRKMCLSFLGGGRNEDAVWRIEGTVRLSLRSSCPVHLALEAVHSASPSPCCPWGSPGPCPWPSDSKVQGQGCEP